MSIWLTTKRVARYGLIGFIRNGFISLSAILIMTITLFVVVTLMISSAALKSVLSDLTQKVDVTVYFVTSATEDQIKQLEDAVKALPEVATVTYITREQALAQFQERHKNDQLTMQALQGLGENPLGASLEIRAKETSQYESIAQYLDAQQASGAGSGTVIDKVNFAQNKTAIDRLTNIIQTSRSLGIAIALILGIASILIVFNTIRLAIYTSREEIGVMNLVGANPWYVRGPFMVTGLLYGVVSALLVLILLYPLAVWLGPTSERFFGTFNVFTYYAGSFPLLFLVTFVSGVALGALSSYLAVSRYLNT
ncbi:ABC transporter permease [Candidatus Kaiserbacteria bacterium]|nr:ABC transporter permease [Candidatus Kaiserbacteria bacterium]